MITRFQELLFEAFRSPQKEIDDFFEQTFLIPLNKQLDGTEIPAEEIRHRRRQTNQIKQHLINLTKK